MHAAKDELRRTMRDRRLALTPDEIAAAGHQAAAHFDEVPGVPAARIVAVYSPIRGELDTLPLVARLRRRGVRLAYPRVERAARLLRFHFVDDEGVLSPGTMGIPEPPPSTTSIDPDEIPVFVVPGLAFDLHGGRLGWGRGYYDNTLAVAPRALRVGFAHEFQLVPAVPSGNDDEHIDWLVTNERAIQIRRNR